MSNLKIRDVRAIITEPPGARTLVVVKVETDEPELYGLGCASFFSRPTAVAAAVYVIVGGRDLVEYEENVHALLEQGFRHFKLGAVEALMPQDEPYHEPVVITSKVTADNGTIFEPASSARTIVRLFEHFRTTFGPRAMVNENILYDKARFFLSRQEVLDMKDSLKSLTVLPNRTNKRTSPNILGPAINDYLMQVIPERDKVLVEMEAIGYARIYRT